MTDVSITSEIFNDWCDLQDGYLGFNGKAAPDIICKAMNINGVYGVVHFNKGKPEDYAITATRNVVFVSSQKRYYWPVWRTWEPNMRISGNDVYVITMDDGEEYDQIQSLYDLLNQTD